MKWKPQGHRRCFTTKILYCHSCDEVFGDWEMTIPNHCSVCEAHDMMEVIDCKRGMELSDRLIEDLWMLFGVIDYDAETETILEDFMDFPAGTWREDIWHWFDKAYTKGVYALMNM